MLQVDKMHQVVIFWWRALRVTGRDGRITPPENWKLLKSKNHQRLIKKDWDWTPASRCVQFPLYNKYRQWQRHKSGPHRWERATRALMWAVKRQRPNAISKPPHAHRNIFPVSKRVIHLYATVLKTWQTENTRKCPQCAPVALLCSLFLKADKLKLWIPAAFINRNYYYYCFLQI